MTGALQGRVAVVTGAGKGLGRAVAERFGAEGATVVVSDIDGDAAERVAAGIPGASHRPCDVRDEQQVQDLVAATVDRHGGLHVLVPNAGVGKAEALLQMDLAAWRAVTSAAPDFEAALFFASDRSAFCNGSGLVLDGGLHASLL
ncbi:MULTISPECIES: SDR family oxidoreductase [unclassified Pseudonocardia]|uniref:SDR family NAD(P)-dependent oxidoreductase n=1 Tax=unclassified Pseudonocardia TaxID=2619320 RepID=UPI0001FFE6FF|nr:SDR family oxidoreductase [Pseudonocardia sp. Ae707_Ps1]OLM18234.1 3-oxoacyl-[acyl-carrier protein] reductase [Pseudonocardia sp. Ae707_Ps1]